MIIEDGKGTGVKAGVNSLNQQETRAIRSTYHQYISCEYGEAYMASLGTEALPTLTVNDTGGYMMYLKNTSTEWLAVLARIAVSTSALTEIAVMKKPDIAALGNNVTITPVNKNFSSGKVAAVECVGWDEVGNGITGIGAVIAGDCAGTYQINGLERILFDESLCLGLNDVIAIKARGVAAAPATSELTMVMHGYYIIPA